MTAPDDRPVVSPTLIGRISQLDLLLRLLEQTRQQRGQVVTIAGEAGIGKSRLIDEIRTRARSYGVQTDLQGRCFEPDQTFPYAPLIDLLRTHVLRSPDTLESHLSDFAPELAHILPELADRNWDATRCRVGRDPGCCLLSNLYR